VYQFFINLLGLLVVPLSLSYINKEKYGIWVNASVMVTWVMNMNFGLGFGMQNKVAESIARNDTEAAQDYVTITYKYCFFIALGIVLLSIPASYFINWNKIYNSTLPAWELRNISWIVFIGFTGIFVFNNLTPLANAVQKASFPKLIGLVTNLFIVILLFTFSKFSHDNLTLASIALSLPGPLLLILANFYFFRYVFPSLRPGWNIRNKHRVKSSFSLGLKFYLMQLSNILLFSSGTFIITQNLGPSEVTPYSLVNRYFYFAYFIFSLGITPFWSAFTDAWIKQDYDWIKKTLQRLFIAGGLAALVVLTMMIASFYIIPLWSRHTFEIYNYKLLVYSSALFTVVLIFSNIISYFLNGISQVNLQMAVQIFVSVLAIPLSILFVKVNHLGSAGVNLAVTLCQFIFIIICGWQMVKIVRNIQRTSDN
jgi:O-antigen/teichoic acid export membrane protein